MRAAARAALLALAVACCTPAERLKVAETVADIAARVCVRGDTIDVCLQRCQDEARRPDPFGPLD